jgi:hypothetical protein
MAEYIQSCYDARLLRIAYASHTLNAAVNQQSEMRHRLPVASHFACPPRSREVADRDPLIFPFLARLRRLTRRTRRVMAAPLLSSFMKARAKLARTTKIICARSFDPTRFQFEED